MQDVQQEPIAIIGIGCRFPQAHNPQEFWTLLREGKDAIREVPADRWDVTKLYDPDSTVPAKMVSRWGGFLDQVDQFDWRAFRMLPREVTYMDPQHRLLLEVAWEALEDAGLPLEKVAGSQTSVSIGISWSDYLRLQTRNWSQLNGYTVMGGINCFAANRLSYVFDLKGPSIAIDTGCTSSLTALYLACQSLWTGEASLALAGGVNLILSPDSMIMESKSGLLSQAGRCKTLDAHADGFVRGEGAGIVILKPLSQVQQSDRVYALIRGIALNHNGHNEWIIAPSRVEQEALLRNAYRKAGIHPSEVDYVELHGTGFQRGDAIEANALGEALGRLPERTRDCLIGSVKTNIGHLEAASGIASVIKVALSLYHRAIPATLHMQTLNPDISLDDLHLAIPQASVPWPQKDAISIAGVTTLAFTGANAHAVLSAYTFMDDELYPEDDEGDKEVGCLLPLSARSEQALYGLAKAYQDFLLTHTSNTASSWRNICYSASVRRTHHHHHRLAIAARSPQEAAEKLRLYLEAQGREKSDPTNNTLPTEASCDLSPSVGAQFIAPAVSIAPTQHIIPAEPYKIPDYLETFKMLYISGHEIDWSRLYREEECHCVSLPLYSWQRERLWPDWLDVKEISTPPEERSTDPQSIARGRGLLDCVHRPPGKGRSIEQVLIELWAEVLGLEHVSASNSFFELGGHSLLAMQLLVRIQHLFQVEVDLKDLLEAPTPYACAEFITQKKASQPNIEEGKSSSLPRIEPDPERRYDPFPTTDVQQAYWVGRQTAFEIGNVGNHGYIEVEATDLDLDCFNQALQRLIERHDMLRAVLLPDGQQQILERVPPFEIKIVDLRGQNAQQQASQLAEIRQTLDHQLLPVEQWPAFELWISHLDERHMRLHLSIESIFVDAWSMNILIQEFIRLYQQPDLSLPVLDLSFRDYVLAEAALQNSALAERSREYWLGRLSSLPAAPDLPLADAINRAGRDESGPYMTGNELPSVGTQLMMPVERPRFVHREARLEKEHWQRLKVHTAKIGLTPSGVLLTAFAEIIARWSKTARFSLNLSTFNRLPLHPQVNQIVGDFTSLLVLAIDHTTPDTFENRARRVQEQLWNDLDHAYYSGIQVLRELAKMHGESIKAIMPIVFTSLLIQDTASPSPPPWGKTLYCVSQTPQVWLDHQVLEKDGELVFHWQSVDAIFPAGLIDAMFDAYYRLLQRLACIEQSWSEPVRDLLPEQQRALLKEVNATDSPVSNKLLHTFFLEQVAQRPDQLAIISETRLLTYKEIHSGVLQLAHQLRAWGARPNQLVGIVMEKGWEQVVAVLGVLLSGAAYLPIDTSLPKKRLWHLLEHGEVEVVLTQSWVDRSIEWPEDLKRIYVDSLNLDEEDILQLESVQSPDDLAYVIYTSGSTGLPKGVMIDHRGAANTILDINRRFSITSTDRVLAISALNFDLSVYDIFGILAAGGIVVLPNEQSVRDPAFWLRVIEQEGITIWNTVPALLQLLVEYAEMHSQSLSRSCLRLALLSGDWIPLALPGRLKDLCPDTEVVSLGGATEASIWSILYPIISLDPSWKSIPYGRPMSNQQFFVLGDDLEPCPLWVPGLLYIAGIGLAKGYWRDEEKTQASFFSHPRTGIRFYRTGDLGRYLPDGTIEFLGREDTQVKVQGHRIELGEIEQTLLQHPAVQTIVATVVTEPERDPRLVAYVVLRSEQEAQANGDCLAHHRANEGTMKSYTLQQLKGQPHGSEWSNRSQEKISPYEALQTLALRFSQTSIRNETDKPVIDLAYTTDNIIKYRQRLSYRKFLQEPISFKQFSDFLQSLSQIELEGLPKYLYPSAGGVYPVQTYVHVKPYRVEEIPAGNYYYNPQSSQLVTLSSNARLDRTMHAEINQPIFDEAAFSLFLIGELTTISSLYGEAARDFCMLEAGYMSQLLMMAATEYQIGLCPIGGLDFEQVRDAFVLGKSHLHLHSLLGGCVNPSLATGWSFLPARMLQPVQPRTTRMVTTMELCHFLKEKLPAYMVPSSIIVLESLPLTANGKVDRMRLSALFASSNGPNFQKTEINPGVSSVVEHKPRSALEAQISRLVAGILKVEQIDPTSNLLEYGATSMDILRIANLLESQFHVRLQMGQLFRLSTIHAITIYCEQFLPVNEVLVGVLEPIPKNATCHSLDAIDDFHAYSDKLLDDTCDALPSVGAAFVVPIWEEGII